MLATEETFRKSAAFYQQICVVISNLSVIFKFTGMDLLLETE